MITDALIEFLLAIPRGILSLLPTFSYQVSTVPAEVGKGFAMLLYGIKYMFPWSALLPLFIAYNGMLMFRIAMAVFKFVKGLIPTMGD